MNWYYRVFNLPVRIRDAMPMLQLCTISTASTYKAAGPSRILAGVDTDGQVHSSETSCFKMQMDLLHKGVPIELPSSTGTGVERWTLKAWTVNFAADYEARMQVLPFSDGVNAHRECHACDREQHSKVAYKAMSWARVSRPALPSKRGRDSRPCTSQYDQWKDDRPGAPFHLRTDEQVRQQVATLKSKDTAAARKEFTRATGVAKQLYALADINCFDIIRMCTNDLMHVEGSSGNLSHEAAQMFYAHTRTHKYYTFDELCASIDKYDFPRGHAVGAPLPAVIKGTTDGQPHAGTTVHWSASQTFHFAIHSVAIIEPLLPDQAKLFDPAWLSWKKHIEYVVLSLSHSFRRSTDLRALAQLVKEHHTLYQSVPEYGAAGRADSKCFMKPKNHAASHLNHTISDGGPLRQLWCMAFERFNQSFKRMAEICNFRDVSKSMVMFWSMASAIELVSGKAGSWGIDVINIAAEYSHSSEITKLIQEDAFASMVGLVIGFVNYTL
mmetsp:Transcript_41817/g.103935  ORF Transcript_41817/g.103935 Transcript_41817/m.103935 type:complete len:497 (+) Transcript_41817:852-2342(+)